MIDTDSDGSIDRAEMEMFLKTLMQLYKDIHFRNATEFMEYKERMREVQNKQLKTKIQNKI